MAGLALDSRTTAEPAAAGYQLELLTRNVAVGIMNSDEQCCCWHNELEVKAV